MLKIWSFGQGVRFRLCCETVMCNDVKLHHGVILEQINKAKKCLIIRISIFAFKEKLKF